MAAAVLMVWMSWGNGTQHGFIGQLLWSGIVDQPWEKEAFGHPLVLLPLLGWICLVCCTVFYPKKWLLWLGAALCLPLVLIVLVAGLLSANLLQTISTLPFCIGAAVLLLFSKKAAGHHQKT